MNLASYTDPIDRLHQADLQYQQLLRFWNPWKDDGCNMFPFSLTIENHLCARLQAQGYQINPTTHSAPFDLWVGDGSRAIRLEIKAARPYYRPHNRAWHYQAAIRNHHTDLLIFTCLHNRLYHFIIPQAVLGQRRNIAIWSKDPTTYTGRWALYLEAWHHLDQSLSTASPQPRQQVLL